MKHIRGEIESRGWDRGHGIENQRERERDPEVGGQRHGGWGTKTKRKMETGPE